MELLQQDKTYLSREVEEARERERKREEEEDRLREKVARCAARERLREKVRRPRRMRSARGTFDGRGGRLQRKANEDLERLREEHGATATARSARCGTCGMPPSPAAAAPEVRGARGYDNALAALRSTQKNADVSHAELAGQLRLKSMELERVSLLHGESVSVAKVLRLECEMLTKKTRLLESQYLNLEAAAGRRARDADARAAETSARLAHYESSSASWTRRPCAPRTSRRRVGVNASPTASRPRWARRVLGAGASPGRLAQAWLGKRCVELEREALAREAAEQGEGGGRSSLRAARGEQG